MFWYTSGATVGGLEGWRPPLCLFTGFLCSQLKSPIPILGLVAFELWAFHFVELKRWQVCWWEYCMMGTGGLLNQSLSQLRHLRPRLQLILR